MKPLERVIKSIILPKYKWIRSFKITVEEKQGDLKDLIIVHYNLKYYPEVKEHGKMIEETHNLFKMLDLVYDFYLYIDFRLNIPY